MKFADFQGFREKLLSKRPGVIDCGATNLYSALAHRIPPATAAPQCTVHRCHLASEWTDRYSLPADNARRALVSCGVRDSLVLLFRHYAEEGARLWLPEDNYPVYGELARAAGLSPREFPTLPVVEWPDQAPTSEAELLVVTNPLKPLGRWLTQADVEVLSAWLTASHRRRLLLDAVYTFETQFHATTLQLIATGQTILLHSLTKGWLQPRLFGIAMVPERDATVLTPVFRAQAPPQLNLARARSLFADHAGMPGKIAGDLTIARERMLGILPKELEGPSSLDAAGYFTPVSGPWRDILAIANILGLPATVFGSQRDDLTILSSLSFLP